MKYMITLMLGLWIAQWGISQNSIGFQIASQSVHTGDVFALDVTTSNFTNILTFQFSIGWDPAKLDLDTLEAYNTVLPLGPNLFNLTQSAQGKLGMYWFDVASKSLPTNAVLFRLKFRALSEGSTSVQFATEPSDIFAEGANGNLVVDTTSGLVTIEQFIPLPANDECTGAISLQSLLGNGINSPQTSTLFDNTDAIANITDPDTGHECFYEASSPLDNTLWFKFTGDGHHYRIKTVQCNAGDDYLTFGDAQIAVYKGGCGNLVPVDCNEDANASASDYAGLIDDLGAEMLVDYYLMVDGCRCIDNNSGVAKGQFCIQMEQLSSVATAAPVGQKRIVLSPNPVSDHTELQFELMANEEIEIGVMDNFGRRIQSILPTQILPAGQHRRQIDTSNLAVGVYFVVIQSGSGQESLRMMKI